MFISTAALLHAKMAIRGRHIVCLAGEALAVAALSVATPLLSALTVMIVYSARGLHVHLRCSC